MIEKLKKTIRTIIDDLTPVEYGIANLTAMLTVPLTMMLLKVLVA